MLHSAIFRATIDDSNICSAQLRILWVVTQKMALTSFCPYSTFDLLQNFSLAEMKKMMIMVVVYIEFFIDLSSQRTLYMLNILFSALFVLPIFLLRADLVIVILKQIFEDG